MLTQLMESGESSLSTSEVSKLEELFQSCKVQAYKIECSDSYLSFELNIWAKPGAKVEKSIVGDEGEIIIYIKERPIDGQANKAFIKYLAAQLSITKSSVSLSRGSKSRFKRFSFQFTFTDRKDFDYYFKKINLFLNND